MIWKTINTIVVLLPRPIHCDVVPPNSASLGDCTLWITTKLGCSQYGKNMSNKLILSSCQAIKAVSFCMGIVRLSVSSSNDAIVLVFNNVITSFLKLYC